MKNKVTLNLKWFTYNQNNSGGSFHKDKDVDVYVIIQATSFKEANDFAKAIGIYFGGVAYGVDCGCCGDRWYPADKMDGKTSPEIYGKKIKIDKRTNKKQDAEFEKGKGRVKVYPYGSIEV